MSNNELLSAIRVDLQNSKPQPEPMLVVDDDVAKILVAENIISEQEADFAREAFTLAKTNPKKALFISLVEIFDVQASLIIDPNFQHTFTVFSSK